MHYRELIVWQKAMDCAREVYRLVPLLLREEVYGMRSQLTRAAVSIPANIAEGWARESTREKTQFFAIAQGSLAETETVLTLCEDFGWFPSDQTARLRAVLAEVGKMLTVMRRKNRSEHP